MSCKKRVFSELYDATTFRKNAYLYFDVFVGATLALSSLDYPLLSFGGLVGIIGIFLAVFCSKYILENGNYKHKAQRQLTLVEI